MGLNSLPGFHSPNPELAPNARCNFCLRGFLETNLGSCPTNKLLLPKYYLPTSLTEDSPTSQPHVAEEWFYLSQWRLTLVLQCDRLYLIHSGLVNSRGDVPTDEESASRARASERKQLSDRACYELLHNPVKPVLELALHFDGDAPHMAFVYRDSIITRGGNKLIAMKPLTSDLPKDALKQWRFPLAFRLEVGHVPLVHGNQFMYWKYFFPRYFRGENRLLRIVVVAFETSKK